VQPQGEAALLAIPGRSESAVTTEDQLWLALRAAGYAPFLARPGEDADLNTAAGSRTARRRAPEG
jgi:hypothetical protein